MEAPRLKIQEIFLEEVTPNLRSEGVFSLSRAENTEVPPSSANSEVRQRGAAEEFRHDRRSVWMEFRDQQRGQKAGHGRIVASFASQASDITVDPKGNGERRFEIGNMIESASHYTIHLIAIGKQWRLPPEPFRALEHGNLGKVTVCKVKTQLLPGGLSVWEASSDTVEKSVSSAVARPSRTGCRINRRQARADDVGSILVEKWIEKGWKSHEVGERPWPSPPTWTCLRSCCR